MEKAAEAFRTISEVALELDVPKHVLRFWEGKFTHIKPMKRGGGRRYYRPEDVELLVGIRRLLHEEGYTIKGVQKLIRQSGVDFVKNFGKGLESAMPLSPQPAAAPRPRGRPPSVRPAATDESSAALVLTRTQTKALTLILAELEACRSLLAKLA